MALTAVLPLSRVAKCLRVSWRDVYQHCVAHHPILVGETPPSPLGFVEVPPVPAWLRPPSDTEIELQRADGTRLWIHSQAPQLPLVAVVRTFLAPR